MANGNFFYEEAKDEILQGNIDLLTNNLKVVGVDLADYGKAISNATNATPIRVTSTSHGFTDGQRVSITGVGGNDAANGRHYVDQIDANTYDLYQDEALTTGVAGSGTYTSGGYAVLLTGALNLDDIAAGGRISTTANLTGKTVTNGVFDATDTLFSAPTGDDIGALVLYKDSGVESTSTLIFLIVKATTLPISPQGVDINIIWASGDDKIFRI